MIVYQFYKGVAVKLEGDHEIGPLLKGFSGVVIPPMSLTYSESRSVVPSCPVINQMKARVTGWDGIQREAPGYWSKYTDEPLSKVFKFYSSKPYVLDGFAAHIDSYNASRYPKEILISTGLKKSDPAPGCVDTLMDLASYVHLGIDSFMFPDARKEARPEAHKVDGKKLYAYGARSIAIALMKRDELLKTEIGTWWRGEPGTSAHAKRFRGVLVDGFRTVIGLLEKMDGSYLEFLKKLFLEDMKLHTYDSGTVGTEIAMYLDIRDNTYGSYEIDQMIEASQEARQQLSTIRGLEWLDPSLSPIKAVTLYFETIREFNPELMNNPIAFPLQDPILVPVILGVRAREVAEFIVNLMNLISYDTLFLFPGYCPGGLVTTPPWEGDGSFIACETCPIAETCLQRMKNLGLPVQTTIMEGSE